MLAALAGKVDRLIPGGGIANTFMLAAGMKIGKSLAEPELAAEAKRIAGILRAKGAEVPLPTDVVCAKEITETARAEIKPVDQVSEDDMILDIGPKTAAAFAQSLSDAGTSLRLSAHAATSRNMTALKYHWISSQAFELMLTV